MKICVFGTRGFPNIQGGVEVHCENMYPLFPLEYNFIVYRRKPYVKSFKKKYSNINFIDLPSTKIKGFETVFHSFLCTLHCIKEKPDIVHIHNIGPALFSPLLALFKIKVILTYHSPNYEHTKWGIIARNILKISEKIAFSFSNAIIFVNKFQENKFASKLNNTFYIPNGITPLKNTNKTDFIESIRLYDERFVLAVGRITPEKGFHILVQAMNKLNDKSIKLVIAGAVETEKTYFNSLKKDAPTDRVIFTGYVKGEKLNQLYTNASLFVLSSFNEGFPLVLLEALSFNLNVLVSDIPATHLVKLKRDDYYQVDDVDSLATKIENKLILNKKFNYDLTDFDWSNIVNRVSCIYKTML